MDAKKIVDKIRLILTTYPLLCYLEFSSRFYLETDSSKEGYGAINFHISDPGLRRVVSYASTSSPKSQKLYSGALLEAAAAAWAMNHFKSFLEHAQFTLRTDNKIMEYLKKL